MYSASLYDNFKKGLGAKDNVVIVYNIDSKDASLAAALIYYLYNKRNENTHFNFIGYIKGSKSEVYIDINNYSKNTEVFILDAKVDNVSLKNMTKVPYDITIINNDFIYKNIITEYSKCFVYFSLISIVGLSQYESISKYIWEYFQKQYSYYDRAEIPFIVEAVNACIHPYNIKDYLDEEYKDKLKEFYKKLPCNVGILTELMDSHIVLKRSSIVDSKDKKPLLRNKLILRKFE